VPEGFRKSISGRQMTPLFFCLSGFPQKNSSIFFVCLHFFLVSTGPPGALWYNLPMLTQASPERLFRTETGDIFNLHDFYCTTLKGILFRP
jgi:hypothetical protein